jgi:hypothetical protein
MQGTVCRHLEITSLAKSMEIFRLKYIRNVIKILITDEVKSQTLFYKSFPDNLKYSNANAKNGRRIPPLRVSGEIRIYRPERALRVEPVDGH